MLIYLFAGETHWVKGQGTRPGYNALETSEFEVGTLEIAHTLRNSANTLGK